MSIATKSLSDAIIIIGICQNGEELKFRILKSTPFSTVKKYIIYKKNISNIHLLFNCGPISDIDTAETLGMENDDVFDIIGIIKK